MPVHGKNATVRIDSTVGGDLASITADVIGPGVDFPREQGDEECDPINGT